MKEAFAVRIGKFKTPFSHGYLTTLGETMMPTLPTSLTAAVIMPYVISKKFADELEELSYQCRHFLNTRSAFTTPAAEDEEEPDENQTTAFDAETAEGQE
mgnify:FL=1